MKATRWKGVALLAAGYFVVAAASLAAAIPPGYSTIVWPAAGLALGALWVWGLELWPGVALGSFAANALVVAHRAHPGPAPYLVSLWISVGASAQAVAAAALARRAVGGREPLDHEGDLLRFLVVGGPIACFISSVWSVIGMRLLGAIGQEEMLFSWANWWIGDCIGVAAAAPVLLLWARRADARRGRIAMTLALTAVLAAATSLQQYSIRDEERGVRARAAQTLEDLSLTLRVGLAGYIDAVQSAGDFLSTAGAVSREQFAHFAAGELDRHPGMQALEWRPRVAGSARRAVEAAARREGLAGFTFTELQDGRVVPRRPADEYFPILYVEPLRGNEKALGLDISHIQGPIQSAAVRALTTGLPTASGGARLVQETAGQIGVAVLTPVRKRPDAEPSGLAEGVFRVGDMMETLLSGVDASAVSVRVYDDTPPGAPELLYERGEEARRTLPPLAMSGDFGGRRWRIELRPSADFEKHPRATLSWFASFGSLVFAYLIAWVILTLYIREERPDAPTGGASGRA
jgi:CHASE1-domain containing sensor protein